MVWAILIFVAGALFAAFSIRLLLKRRLVLAGVHGVAGLSLVSVSSVLFLLFLNVYTYTRLTGEIELARIIIDDTDSAGTLVTLLQPDKQYRFHIKEGEWQLDARFLKWKPWASLLGKDPVVRLERLSGREVKPTGMSATVHEFSDQESIIRRIGSALSDWIGVVDTYYGSSVYMPVEEGAIYVVSASISGLVARPANIQAKQAVNRWMSP